LRPTHEAVVEVVVDFEDFEVLAFD